MRRFHLVPEPGGPGSFDVSISLPPLAPPGGGDDGGDCGVNGPYLRWCGQGFPTADYKGIILVIEGVADESAVEWTTTIGVEDAFFMGAIDRRAAMMKVINFELTGTVTATVDGTAYPLAINMAETACDPA